MSSEYFCKIALLRSDTGMQKVSNTLLYNTLKRPGVAGFLGGAATAGGLGLRSVRGARNELASKIQQHAAEKADLLKQLDTMKGVARANMGSLEPSLAEQGVNAFAAAGQAGRNAASSAFHSDISNSLVSSLGNIRQGIFGF
jgi:hypothetical protein